MKAPCKCGCDVRDGKYSKERFVNLLLEDLLRRVFATSLRLWKLLGSLPKATCDRSKTCDFNIIWMECLRDFSPKRLQCQWDRRHDCTSEFWVRSGNLCPQLLSAMTSIVILMAKWMDGKAEEDKLAEAMDDLDLDKKNLLFGSILYKQYLKAREEKKLEQVTKADPKVEEASLLHVTQ